VLAVATQLGQHLRYFSCIPVGLLPDRNFQSHAHPKGGDGQRQERKAWLGNRENPQSHCPPGCTLHAILAAAENKRLQRDSLDDSGTVCELRPHPQAQFTSG
jgi:hypothetical protein